MVPTKAVLLVSPVVLFAGTVLAQVIGNQERPRPVGKCGKVAVTELYLTNVNGVGIPPWHAILGEHYKLKMTVQNCTRSNLNNVPIAIEKDGARWVIDTVNLPAGGTQTRELSWTAEEGGHRFVARVDPNGSLNETLPERLDNDKPLEVEPRGVNLTGSLVRIVARELDYVKAFNAGAGFNQGVSEGINTCTRIGVDDGQGSHNYVFGQPGVVFMADCPGLPAPPPFGTTGTGGRADPEAFTNFRLKNGWKVKSFSLKFSTNSGNSASDWHDSLSEAQSRRERRDGMQNFSLDTEPAVGTDNPHMKAHIGVKPGGLLKVYVKVIIEGPENADPYGDPQFTRCGGNPTGDPALDYVRVQAVGGGTKCVLKKDLIDCATPPNNYSCETDSDCSPEKVCVVTPCGNHCLRPKPPGP